MYIKVTPHDHISDLGSITPFTTYGAIYSSVPTPFYLHFLSLTLLDTPKSMSFMSLWLLSSNIFSGFKSQCMNPLLCI